MGKIKYAGKPQITVKELNINQVIGKKLHEIKQEILGVYGGEFEMIEKLPLGLSN